MRELWIVAKIRHSAHFVVKRNYECYFKGLIPGVLEFFIPYYEISRRVIILLPNYLFVKVLEDFEYPKWVKYEPYIKGFLVREDRLCEVPENEMELFKKKSEEYIKLKKFEAVEFVKDKIVFIKKGIFAGLFGVVKDVNDKKGEVKISLENFRVTIWIKKDYLEIV